MNKNGNHRIILQQSPKYQEVMLLCISESPQVSQIYRGRKSVGEWEIIIILYYQNDYQPLLKLFKILLI